MDPVSHVAFGRTLIALDGRRALGAGAIAACVLGSLAPDADAVFMPFGWDLYLRMHQGGTHSLIGSIAGAALTAAGVRMGTRGGRYLPLLLAAWAGTAGHLLLDVASGADIGFFWPFGKAVALPLFAMADPWLGGLLVLGVVALALRPAGTGPRNPARPGSARTAAAVLIAVAILSAGKLALYARVRSMDEAAGRPVLSRRAEAAWGSLTQWITYDATADVVEARRVNAVTGAVAPLLHVVRGLDDPLVVTSRELATVRNFLAAHGVTFAIVIGAGAEARQVLWSDVRYCGPPGNNGAMPWAPIDLGRASPVGCALWFGGEFDRAGRPIAEIVHVGHLQQRR